MSSVTSQSRIERLLVLVENGSSFQIRSAAAVQVGEVVKLKRDEFFSLVARIVSILIQSKIWDARIAAGRAIEEIVKNEPVDSIGSDDYMVRDALQSLFEDIRDYELFDLEQIIVSGERLLSSTGKEFETPQWQNMSLRERLEFQRGFLKKSLKDAIPSIGGESGRSDSIGLEFIKDEDLIMPCESHVAMSIRQKHQMKRKAKMHHRTMKQKGKKKKLPGDEEGCADVGFQLDTSRLLLCPDPSRYWNLGIVVCFLSDFILDDQWTVRHGSTVGLYSLLKPFREGKMGVFDKNESREMFELIVKMLSRKCLHLLAVENFADYIGDAPVSPVKESCSLLLGLLSTFIRFREKDLMFILTQLLFLIGSQDSSSSRWQSRQGGLLGLRQVLLSCPKECERIILNDEDLFEDLCKKLYLSLADIDDDIRVASSNILIAVFGIGGSELMETREEKLFPDLATCILEKGSVLSYWNLEAVLRKSLESNDDISPSTSSIMRLMSFIYDSKEFVLSSSMFQGSIEDFLQKLIYFMRHPLTSVRFCSLGTLSSLFVGFCGISVSSGLISSVLKMLFQNILIEDDVEILELSFSVFKAVCRIGGENMDVVALLFGFRDLVFVHPTLPYSYASFYFPSGKSVESSVDLGFQCSDMASIPTSPYGSKDFETDMPRMYNKWLACQSISFYAGSKGIHASEFYQVLFQKIITLKETFLGYRILVSAWILKFFIDNHGNMGSEREFLAVVCGDVYESLRILGEDTCIYDEVNASVSILERHMESLDVANDMDDSNMSVPRLLLCAKNMIQKCRDGDMHGGDLSSIESLMESIKSTYELVHMRVCAMLSSLLVLVVSHDSENLLGDLKLNPIIRPIVGYIRSESSSGLLYSHREYLSRSKSSFRGLLWCVFIKEMISQSLVRLLYILCGQDGDGDEKLRSTGIKLFGNVCKLLLPENMGRNETSFEEAVKGGFVESVLCQEGDARIISLIGVDECVGENFVKTMSGSRTVSGVDLESSEIRDAELNLSCRILFSSNNCKLIPVVFQFQIVMSDAFIFMVSPYFCLTLDPVDDIRVMISRLKMMWMFLYCSYKQSRDTICCISRMLGNIFGTWDGLFGRDYLGNATAIVRFWTCQLITSIVVMEDLSEGNVGFSHRKLSQSVDMLVGVLISFDDLSLRKGTLELIFVLFSTCFGDGSNGLEECVLPYLTFFLIPVMNMLSDADMELRLLSAKVFSLFLQWLGLEVGVDDPVYWKEDYSGLSLRRLENRKICEHFFHPDTIPPFDIPIEYCNRIGEKLEGFALRPYQKEGVNWLFFLYKYGLHGILCDDMGLGKTIQSLTIVASVHFQDQVISNPSLIVCPSSLISHWKSEAEKYVGRYLFPFVYYGPDRARDSQSLIRNVKDGRINLIVTSYEMARQDEHFLARSFSYNYIVLDEGHIIKNPRSKISLAIKRYQAKHRLILSGTPVQNNIVELWSLFDFLMPGYLGTFSLFMKEYGRPILLASKLHSTGCGSGSGPSRKIGREISQRSAKMLESLHRQTLPFLLRRLKEDVLDDLPPKIIQDFISPLSGLQKRLYERFTEWMLGNQSEDFYIQGSESDEEIGVTEATKMHVFPFLQTLRRICSSPLFIMEGEMEKKFPFVLGVKKEFEISNMRTFINCNPLSSWNSKLSSLQELLLECGIGCGEGEGEGKGIDGESIEDGEFYLQGGGGPPQHRALVFCQSRLVLEHVEEHLLNRHMPSVSYLKLDGSVAIVQRSEVVDRFNSDSSIDILLLTTSIGGQGLTLTGADTVIFVECDWNPTKDLQAMDRAHRMGQKRTVNVYRLISKDTIEEKLLGLQRFKLSMAGSIITQQNSALRTMEMKDVLEILKSE